MSRELRPLSVDLHAAPVAEGSCILSAGRTRVLCTATVEEGVPSWKERAGGGWVTAEYSMLPRATHRRTSRERTGPRGRTQEIQRLIGRSLRSVMDLDALGPRTITVDCDVLQADGGTRTASITGGYLALALACRGLVGDGAVIRNPLREAVAAVSVGLIDGAHHLDLDYALDVRADVDMNVVATESGRLVEVQGTAEGLPFTRSDLDELLDLALGGIERILAFQREALSRA